MTSEDHRPHPRRSLGGRVVEDSLQRVGFAFSPHVQMVETARPGVAGGRTVLVQNAWNFIGNDEFVELARHYPDHMRRRMRQRRLLATVNVRRASRVVALTAPMAELVERRTGRQVQTSEVLHPLDLLTTTEELTGLPDESFVLVPGTISWYKDPLVALTLVASRADLPTRVVLAGSDDGSGCWQEVRRFGDLLDLDVTAGPVARPVMKAALRRATAVLVPSRLESLGFSLSEALALSPGEVVASPIPAHVDVAARAGRPPSWVGQEPAGPPPQPPAPPEIAAVRDSWVALGQTLGLRRTEQDRD